MKFHILILIVFMLSCTQDKYSQHSPLDYMKLTQNADGSWGDKNKIYCTSLAIVTYLTSSETPSSKMFGESVAKGIEFLERNQENIAKKDLSLYFWALSKVYAYTGSDKAKSVMGNKLIEFRKSLHLDYQKRPQDFFLEIQAIHEYRMSGGEYDFSDLIESLSLKSEHNSLVLCAVKRQWAFDFKESPAVTKLVDQLIQEKQTNYFNDLILGRYIFLTSDRARKVKFQAKIEQSLKRGSSYKFSSRFSAAEKSLLHKMVPKFVYEFSFPMRYLPSSKAVFPVDKKEEMDLIIKDKSERKTK